MIVIYNLLMFSLSVIFGYLIMSFALSKEEVGVIFVQENDFDLPEQNSK